MEETPLIRLEQVNKYYQSGDQYYHALKDLTLSIFKGEFVSIMGPSGSGKSTLMNILGFLDGEFDGTYLMNGEKTQHFTDEETSQLRNKHVGFVFQDFNLIETMNVSENIRLPLLYAGIRRKDTETRVKEALSAVGLQGKGARKIKELSGGQRQRVAIARALINHPDFILADEPTGALDSKTSRQIMDILKELHDRDGVTIVMVTHDPSLQQYASRHIVIVDGKLKEQSETLDVQSLMNVFNEMEEES